MEETKVKPNQEEEKLSDWTFNKFKQAMLAKEPLTTKWKIYKEAYDGDYFEDESRPDYKSNLVTNFIFSTIESIRPIMADADPSFDVLPRNEMGMEYADIVSKCLSYEFEREKMQTKILKALTTSLQVGTSIFFLPWNGNKGVDGEVECILVNPFNLYPDPNATCVEDAEYIIYATYKHVNQVKQMFPSKANLLEGGSIKYDELATNKETREGQKDETQILILETWCRDYTYIDFEEEENGKTVTKRKRKYPRGRVITTAPELNVVLDDKENPYEDGRFPFVILKDHDVPFEFWGKGDIEQIISPQIYINELTNQIIDNAKTMANAQWIVDKNAGIAKGKLTNRPGLIIRKQPGSEVRREQAPSMPSYVAEQVERMKLDIESISGVHDVTQGRRPTGIQAGNAIMALQEAGQARIRIKIKIMEEALGELARMWFSRMKQFWIAERYIRITKEDGAYEFLAVTRENFEHEYDINITSGSTMNKNKSAILDMMIRLGQTMAEDGLPIVDREAILEYVPIPNKREVLKRFEAVKQQQQEQQVQQAQEAYNQMAEQLGAQVKELASAVQEIVKQVQSLNQDVDKIEYEHEKIKQQERLTDMKRTGYEQGVIDLKTQLDKVMSEGTSGMPSDEASLLANSSPMLDDGMEGFEAPEEVLPDELLQQLSSLPPDQLKEFLEMNPGLQEKIMTEQQNL